MRLAVPFLAALAASLASAETNPAAGLKCSNDGIGPCLSSFAWCSDDGTDCRYPANTNPLGVGSRGIALYRGRKYTVSWTDVWRTDVPIQIQWIFPQYDASGKVGDREKLWTTNVTATGRGPGSYVFDPEVALSEFPTPQSDMTRAEAIVAASQKTGFIRVWQEWHESRPLWTQEFIVLDPNAGDVADTANEYARRRRIKELGIGIGVGLGLGAPIVVLTTLALARPDSWLRRRIARTKPVV